MADTDDVAELESGSVDLSYRDFSELDLSGRSFENVDFTGSNLQGARFHNARLRGARFSQAQLFNTQFHFSDLREAQFDNGGYAQVSFRDCDLRDANFRQTLVSGCEFRNADLRGAKFTNGNFQNQNDFNGANIDERTDFEYAAIMRAAAKDPIFRYFEFKGGRLARRADAEAISPTPAKSEFTRDVDRVIGELVQLQPANGAAASPGVGHNGPPEGTPFELPAFDSLISDLESAKSEVGSESPSASKLQRIANSLVGAGKQILRWVAAKCDRAIDKAFEEFGKSLGDTNRLIVLWLALTERLNALAHHLAELATKLH